MKKSFVVVSSVAIVLVGLLTTFFLVQNRIENRSRAEKTATLSFSPPSSNTTPFQVSSGDTFSLDVLLNPGTNLVSSTTVHILYDSSKLAPIDGVPFQWNQDAFTQLVNGPIFTPGEITFSLSIGPDSSKAIKTQARIGTITFRALDSATTTEGPTLVSFATDSQALSISSNSSPTENVINSTIPATITINQSTQSPALTPTPPAHTATSAVTIPIPKIKCLLPNQLCQPMFVTSVETDSVLKANYKVANPSFVTNSVLQLVSDNHSKGNQKDIFGKKPLPTPTPVLNASCSSVRIHFYVDGVKKYTSGWLGWQGASTPYNQLPLETGDVDLGPVSSGPHILGVQAEGMTSGCDKGVLAAWAGSVVVTTSSSVLPPPPPTACKDKAPADVMMVMDTSGSMNDRINRTQGTKLQNAKTAATNFINILSSNTTNKLGLVSFGTTATLNNNLTANYSSVTSKVTSLSAKGWTCHECAVKKASQEISSNGRPGIKKVVVLLTDGRANAIEGKSTSVSTSLAEQKALTAVTNDFNTNQTVYYTIGLGQDVNANFLKQIANATGGRYYFSPTADDLNTIYQQISQILAQGSVSGFVYNDQNANGIYDTNEDKLTDWQIQLTSQTGSPVQTVTTDESGAFNLSGVCGGTYLLREVPQSGWTQTQPSNGGNYTITINNGNAVTDKNFGNKSTARCSDNIDNDNNGFADAKDSTCHTDGNPANPGSYDPEKDGEHGGNTCADSQDNNGNGLIDGADPVCHTGGNPLNPWDPTLPEISPTTAPTATTAPTVTTAPTLTVQPTNVPEPTDEPSSTPGDDTLINLNLFLHGIGGSGDNTNPVDFNLSNQNPLHTTRTASVLVFDANNNPLTSTSGTINFSSQSGSFKGTVNLGASLATGVYTVKVKVDQHLYRLVAGIQTLTTGEANTLPTTELVAGDTNDDNKINILDYNAIINCYSDLGPATACNPTLKLQTDLNDDDSVNQVDYNLFLREIATQPGQ